FWGATTVALFSVGLTLSNLATQGPLLLAGALLPRFAQLVTAEAPERSRDAYASSMRIMAFIVFPACFGVAGIAPGLVPAIFGQAFAPAVPSAVILVSAAAFGAVATTAIMYMLALDRTRFNVISGLVGVALTVVAGLLVIPSYGFMGAAIARATIQVL